MTEIFEPITGEVDIQDPSKSVCFGPSCPDMGWLVDAVIERDYQGVIPEQRALIVADETDYASRECVRLGFCLARDKRLADEGVQHA